MVPHARIYQKELEGKLTEDNFHRLTRVLRLREGDKFIITNGEGGEAEASLKQDGFYSAPEWEFPNREPDLQVTIFAALSKGDRLEWLVEKAVEMGVKKIVPLVANRCVVKKPSRNKLERWRKVALTAMIQCGGCVLPEVSEPVSTFALPQPETEVLPILLHEEALSVSLHSLPEPEKGEIWLASGPEGGFDEKEIGFFRDSRWQMVWLGKRLFKTDTAPVIALANILSGAWGTSS